MKILEKKKSWEFDKKTTMVEKGSEKEKKNENEIKLGGAPITESKVGKDEGDELDEFNRGAKNNQKDNGEKKQEDNGKKEESEEKSHDYAVDEVNNINNIEELKSEEKNVAKSQIQNDSEKVENVEKDDRKKDEISNNNRENGKLENDESKNEEINKNENENQIEEYNDFDNDNGEEQENNENRKLVESIPLGSTIVEETKVNKEE